MTNRAEESYAPIFFLAISLYIWLFSSRENENRHAKNFFKKISITFSSLIFMILSKDSKGVGPKYNADPDLIKDKQSKSKTVIFVRHGESDWNNVFNKGIGISAAWRLLRSMVEELSMAFYMDSKFLDSPLNFEGIAQALELRRFLESDIHPESKDNSENDERKRNLFEIMRGEKERSIIVTSSLRRAISTTTLAFWPRIEKTGEKIFILSSLQEISRNIDTRALSKAKEVADLPFSRISPYCLSAGGNFSPDEVYDTTENYGNKTRTFYGGKRLTSFNEWIFQRDETVIIAGGHSLWFKNYFQTYMPHHAEHDAKMKKITNSGAVSFTVHRAEDSEGAALYRIEPSSIEVLYGGFTTK